MNDQLFSFGAHAPMATSFLYCCCPSPLLLHRKLMVSSVGCIGLVFLHHWRSVLSPSYSPLPHPQLSCLVLVHPRCALVLQVRFSIYPLLLPCFGRLAWSFIPPITILSNYYSSFLTSPTPLKRTKPYLQSLLFLFLMMKTSLTSPHFFNFHHMSFSPISSDNLVKYKENTFESSLQFFFPAFTRHDIPFLTVG